MNIPAIHPVDQPIIGQISINLYGEFAVRGFAYCQIHTGEVRKVRITFKHFLTISIDKLLGLLQMLRCVLLKFGKLENGVWLSENRVGSVPVFLYRFHGFFSGKIICTIFLRPFHQRLHQGIDVCYTCRVLKLLLDRLDIIPVPDYVIGTIWPLENIRCATKE